MRGLSNLFRNRDPAELIVRPVGPGEIESAVRLLLGGAGHSEGSAAAAEFEALAAKRDIDLLGIQVAFVSDHMIAAALPVDGGGRAVLLMISAAGASRQVAIAVACCAKACVIAANQPQRLFQILIDPSEWRAAEELRQRGFEDLASLLYMQRILSRIAPRPEIAADLTLVNDSPQNRHMFELAILGSYEQSLDCPKLHGMRSIDEVMAAHKSTGEYDPSLWFCLMKGDKPVGVLLLSRVPGAGALELVYLGLTLPGRGQGLGDLLMQLALSEASLSPNKQLMLAVDDQNVPALRLYYRHGLSQVHTRLAMMCSAPAVP